MDQNNISNLDKWKNTILGSVLEKIEGGGTPSKAIPEYWDGNIPWASVKDIVNHNPIGTQDYISDAGLANSSAHLIPSGTLITSTRMALGTAVFYNVDVAINQDLKAIYPSKEVNKKFLFYWVKQNSKKIEKLGTGSTVAGIQQKELKALSIAIPPLQEQKRIVEVLETWDKYLQLLDKKIEIKKSIKNCLVQDLTTSKKRLPRYKHGWQEIDMESIGTFSKGSSITKAQLSKDGLCAIRYGEIYTKHDMVIKKIYSYISKDIAKLALKINKGDIIFAASGETIDEIAKSAVYDLDDTCFAGGDTIIFSPKDQNSIFLAYLLNSNSARRQLRKLGQGQSVVHIYTSGLKKMIITIPEKTEQDSITKILIAADDEIEILENKKSILEGQKKFLLNNLVTGQFRLPEFINK
jgi:type I restriction enzyme S subunit